jgi:prophage regulatory protein
MSHVLLSYDDLQRKGIRRSKPQLWRDERDGRFPKRVYPSPGRVAWVESEIDEHIRTIIADRDGGAPVPTKRPPGRRSSSSLVAA